MKKIILSFSLLFFYNLSFSQVTKADLESLLSELGTSMDKMESLYCGNTLTFYNDGTFKRTYDKYNRNNNEYQNTFKLSNSGIVVSTTKSGKISSRKIYAFASIKFVNIGLDYIEIELRD